MDINKHFETSFPELVRYASTHTLWQNTRISKYYGNKSSYWHDYDPYTVSESLGQDRIKLSHDNFLDAALHPLNWDESLWANDLIPVWQQKWAVQWDFFRQHVLYLLHHNEIEQAQEFLKIYRPHFNEEYQPAYAPLYELELAVAKASGDKEQVESLADNLVGMTEDRWSRSHWGKYVKAKSLVKRGDIKEAFQLMLPVVNSLELDDTKKDKGLYTLLGYFTL